MYSHRSTVLHSLVGALPDATAVRNTDVVLPVTPMFHANSWGMPYGAVMLGVKLVFPGPHLHPEDLLDLMQQEPPTLTLGVPTIWLAMIQLYDSSLQPGSPHHGRWQLPTGLRSMVGGAAVPESLIRAFGRHGVWIMQGWGMTETSPVGTLAYPRAELQGASDDERLRRAAMAGVPMPLVDLRIRGDHGQDQPWDGTSVGELQVRGPFITGGYHEAGAPPDKFTADGWLRTGDVGQLDRRRLAPHRRHRRDRRRRLPVDHRPQEGHHHHRGRQEHHARQPRGRDQAAAPDQAVRGDRRPPPLPRRAGHPRP